uniref:tRNA dimethylallyltransferase n=1 Tax=Paulinella micropora TaxID=1928728 RepID=A0A385I0H7_9EUKA|nr:tRNA delta-2-isopentenylpyrophosphate transferase [Paulinella micropora]AXY63388.1 tRNA delta-2-isopentenylpyrophosphate transferase [Paulinella micropora]
MTSILTCKKLPLIITLIGPTASGKTDLAIALAQCLNLPILSIDSRQLYSEMEIGTTQPTISQRAKVQHELLGLRKPNDPINLQEFVKVASRTIQKEHERCGVAFLVGGSGLYVKALTNSISPPAVPPHTNLRDQLEYLGKQNCNELLHIADPASANRIDSQDSVRTQRALEVIYTTGEPLSMQQGQNVISWRLLELGLDPGVLRQRIQKRSISLYKKGLVEETRRLINRYGHDLPLLKTIGYGEICRWLFGEIDLKTALIITIHRTLQYAKRQRTWFYHQHEVLWLNEANPLEHALIAVEHVLG